MTRNHAEMFDATAASAVGWRQMDTRLLAMHLAQRLISEVGRKFTLSASVGSDVVPLQAIVAADSEEQALLEFEPIIGQLAQRLGNASEFVELQCPPPGLNIAAERVTSPADGVSIIVQRFVDLTSSKQQFKLSMGVRMAT